MTSGVPSYLRDDVPHMLVRPWPIAAHALRFSTRGADDLLALMATQGVWDRAQIVEWARGVCRRGTLDGADPIEHVHAVAALAALLVGRPGPGDDFTDAADLYQAVRVLRDSGRPYADNPMTRDVDLFDAQTNLAVGRVDYVKRILPGLVVDDDSRWMLETELVHPKFGEPGSTTDDWLRAFNRLFSTRGLQEIDIGPAPGTPFDRIVSAERPPLSTVDGPLVSIVMSVFKPDRSLLTALRSLVDQTWPHLQILVVDDCSPPEYQSLIDEAVALDDRIEFLRMPVNGGTYMIRNAAMALARGELVAFQDSDDWSHPQRIELQLRPLLDDPDLVATLSRAVRVDEQLSANLVGSAALRQNASSLMFRRERVLNALGGFDEVRKAADSEFTQRMGVVFGADRIVVLELPLALVQLTRVSLSRGDFRFGWHHINRVAYRAAYSHWHTRIAEGESPRLVPSRKRRFPAPTPFLVNPPARDLTCDVVVVSDCRERVPHHAGGVDEIRALVGAGRSTMLLHAETLRDTRRGRRSPSPEIMQMRARGALTAISWEDEVTASLALIRDPEMLSFVRPSEITRLSADQVVIYAACPPQSPDHPGHEFRPDVVEAHAQEMFGVQPTWQPATSAIADALHAHGATAPMAAPRPLGVVPIRRRPYAGLRGFGRPIIGTSLVDAGIRRRQWRRALGGLLPDDDAFDIRIRDGDEMQAPLARPGLLPPNWLLIGSPDLGSFLRSVDMFVGLAVRPGGTPDVHLAAQALAHGCVAILDPSLEPVFGDAAVYTSDGSVSELAGRLAADGAAFAAQQERGYQWCAANLSTDAFLAALDRVHVRATTLERSHV